MRVCLLFTLLSCRLFAAGEETAIRSTFVNPWANAMRQAAQTKNTAPLMRFVHPQVLACITPESREFFEGNAARDIAHDLKGPYSVSKIAPLTGPNLLSAFLPGDGFPLIVTPTYEVQISWGDMLSSYPSRLPMVLGIKCFHARMKKESRSSASRPPRERLKNSTPNNFIRS